MICRTIRVDSLPQALTVFQAVFEDRRFNRYLSLAKDHPDLKQAKNDARVSRHALALTKRHFRDANYQSWPGMHRLGFEPKAAFISLTVSHSKRRIRVSAEPMVESVAGECFSRDEALGIPPLPPTLTQIESRAKSMRTTTVRHEPKDILTQGPKVAAIRAYSVDAVRAVVHQRSLA